MATKQQSRLAHGRLIRSYAALGDGAPAEDRWGLALVPLGHALRRLPAGNVGRATVSAFRPMRPEERVRRLIAMAMRP